MWLAALIEQTPVPVTWLTVVGGKKNGGNFLLEVSTYLVLSWWFWTGYEEVEIQKEKKGGWGPRLWFGFRSVIGSRV